VLFPTVSFAVFFAIVLPVSWLLMPNRVRWRLFMIAASWFFYGCAGWGFVPLLMVSTVANHFLAFRIDRAEGDARKWWARVAVAANLAGLGWFKYVGFLTSSSNSLLDYIGFGLHVSVPKVALPAGISFFTFQAISYVVDVNRRKLHPVGLLDFGVYLSFFPHLLAGPIVRAAEFLPQIRRPIPPRNLDSGRGLWFIARGLFKKVVISSYLSTQAVDPLFGIPKQHAGIEALFGVYAYAIQIYADFSGYTDIAIGLALLLGVRFPVNFNSPYRSLSLQEFWRRWHMTLSRFLRDYLYIPLGGNRRGKKRTYINLMVTMLLGGLWHGAAWTFVVWGGLHGVGLAVERFRPVVRARAFLARLRDRQDAPVEALVTVPATGGTDTTTGAIDVSDTDGPVFGPPLPVRYAPLRKVGAWLVTFNLVCLGWIFFRATSFGNAAAVLGRIFSGGRHVHLDSMVVLVVVASLAAQWIPPAWSERLHHAFSTWGILAQALSLALVLVVIDAFGPPVVAPFIYFKF
jgi:D-alanyl-lipoteichoic acid acyltransferase DltB (MBOAT superfamily)